MAIDQTLAVELTPEQKQAQLEAYYAKLGAWAEKSEQLKALKEAEMELRNDIVQFFFPNGLKEGTNEAELPEGWELNVKGSINRKIDVAVVNQVKQEAAEKYEIDFGEAIKYKPELDLPMYRELQKQVELQPEGEKRDRAKAILALFDSLLIISDGSPQVELKAPKRPKAKVSA